MNYLIVVESPNKCRKIQQYLSSSNKNDKFKVVATLGHINEMSTKVEYRGFGFKKETFEPRFNLIAGHEDVQKKIVDESKESDFILIATDPDREGEGIAWHIYNMLIDNEIDQTKIKRITFNEITQEAVQKAFENQQDIDMNMVNSQQARQVLDRILGFGVSYFLQNQDGVCRSAGRVQSVALKLIIERWKENTQFAKIEYWRIFTVQNGLKIRLKLEDDKSLKNEDQAKALVAQIKPELKLMEVKKTKKTKNAYQPLSTADALQLANKKLGYPIIDTTKYLQSLFEKGMITYPRTDAKRYDGEFIEKCISFIKQRFGEEYPIATALDFKQKVGAQDAHESIRITKPSLSFDEAKKIINDETLYMLYELIWKNTVYSLFKPIVYSKVDYAFSDGQYDFKASNAIYEFDSYLAFEKNVAIDEDEEQEEFVNAQLTLKKNDIIKVTEGQWTCEQGFTKPLSLYTEATLVDRMDKEGVGRPSTYANMISILFKRTYIDYKKDKQENNKKQLVPTELGLIAWDKYLSIYFSELINEKYTASMEKQLDEIAVGKVERIDFLRNFLEYFENMERSAYNSANSDKEKCRKCKEGYLIEKRNKSDGSAYLACSNFPKCRLRVMPRKSDQTVTK